MLCKIVCKKRFFKCKMLKNRAALDVSKIMSYRYSMLLGNIVLSELWLYDNEIIHMRGGIIAPQVPSLRGTRGAIIPPQVWIISLSYNQS